MTRSMPSLLLSAVLALAGCTIGDNYEIDAHSDPQTRMMRVAIRLEEDRRRGGMAGAIDDIEACYASTIGPPVQVYALRDCLVLDYVTQQLDEHVGRTVFKQSLPYFESNTTTARWGHYGPLAQFDSPQRQARYTRDCAKLVQIADRQLNAEPLIVGGKMKLPAMILE